MSDSVDFKTDAVKAMELKWHLPDTLLGGTTKMRSAKTTYLPQEPKESNAAYENRVDRSFLFNAYKDTLEHVSTKPLARSVVLQEESPPLVFDWEDDVDLEGTNLTQFTGEIFYKAIHKGLTHALTDVPAPPRRAGSTLADDRARGLRPYFVHVPPESILGWRSERFRGERVLTQLRIQETEMVPQGLYGEATVNRIRVYTRVLPGSGRRRNGQESPGRTFWQLFEQGTDSNQWQMIEQGPVSLGRIPLRTFYANRMDFMIGEPPFLDLADKNLEHWQSASDQRHILHVARVPILWGAGWKRDDLVDPKTQKQVEIGPNRALFASEANAKLGYTEHQGNGIDAGRQDLLDIMDQMVRLGLKPFVEREGVAHTATEAAIRSGDETSQLKSWIRGLERFLEALFDDALEWVNQDPGAIVDVFSDFGALGASAEELRAARAAGDITRETYWGELVRRGILAGSFDPDAEAAQLKEQAQEAAASMPQMGDDGSGDEKNEDEKAA